MIKEAAMQSNKERILGSEKFSLAHLSLIEQPIFELIKMAEMAGYDYVSPRLVTVTEDEDRHDFVGHPNKIRECKALLNDNTVKVLDIELLSIKPDTNVEDEFAPVLEVAAEIGALYAIAQIHDPNLPVSVEKFAQLCRLAQGHNIEVVLEMLPWSSMSSLKMTHDLLEEINLPNTGILFDMLHMYRTQVDPDVLESIQDKYFKFVHLCDARGSGIDSYDAQKHIARRARYPAGRGDIPVLSYLDKLPVHKYSLEIPNARLQKYLGPQEYARYILEDSKNYLLLADCWRVKSKYFSVPDRID